MTLGSILGGFGRLLGATWTLLGVSWTLLGRLWNALGRLLGTSWVSWAPLERFFGSWEGWGMVLEGFWKALGRLLGKFWEGVGGSWRLLGHFLASFLGLVFRMLSERALGGFWAPFWLHFERFGKGLGSVLGELGW